MKLIFTLSFICLLFSCKNGKKEISDMNDIVAKSKNYNGAGQKEEIKAKKLILSDVFLDKGKIDKSTLELNQIRLTDTLLFPDRFKTTKKSSFVYDVYGDSVLHVIWNFKDSIKTQNAFLNWTNCFGPKCNSIGIGEKSNLSKDGFLLLMNDTCIVYIGTNQRREHFKWIDYYTFGENPEWTFVLTQMPKDKVLWRTYRNKRLEPIEGNIISYE